MARNLGEHSQYTIADQHVSCKLPTNISWEGANTIPLAAATAWLALI
jgi:NADPH:quinone reductase-like Zn-dependent oxidoreductase